MKEPSKDDVLTEKLNDLLSDGDAVTVGSHFDNSYILLGDFVAKRHGVFFLKMDSLYYGDLAGSSLLTSLDHTECLVNKERVLFHQDFDFPEGKVLIILGNPNDNYYLDIRLAKKKS